MLEMNVTARRHACSAVALGAVLALGALPSMAAPTNAEAPAAMPLDASAAVVGAVQASHRWIAAFNRGDHEECARTYLPDAVMDAQPFGVFRGRAAIGAFWRDLVAKGANQLRYDRIKLEQVDANTVLISADWRMNIGGGVITQERWVSQGGRWMLAEDRFQVQDTPTAKQ